jgi:hypothetical protein
MPYEELKQRQSVMWGNGPYQRVTETIGDIHERVIDALDPQPLPVRASSPASRLRAAGLRSRTGHPKADSAACSR